MTSGFDDFSLAIFTTLSPAGTIAFICACIPLLFFTLSEKERGRLNRALALPYVFALVGFIASATHLGTPSNALHVFSGIGRSPLSNEVLCAVIFLFVAGSYWMMSFKENFNVTLARLWLGVACLAGIALVAMTSLAYSVETVISWNSDFTPINLMFSALLAGPVLGILTCTFAQLEYRRYYYALTFITSISLLVGTGFLMAHNNSLSDISNYAFSAADLVPAYPATIILHAISGCIGTILAFLSLRKNLSRRTVLLLLVFACLFLLVSVFLPRIAFYQIHMTAGF